jgi:hypothetical protein
MLADEIQLAERADVIPRQDTVTGLPEMTGGRLLPRRAELLVATEHG